MKAMKLSEYLKKYNLKQADIAAKTKISQPTISRVVNDPKYTPRLQKIIAIVEATGGEVGISDFQ